MLIGAFSKAVKSDLTSGVFSGPADLEGPSNDE
ncbi:hypothetical protein FBZ93_111107 [Bradyrhizobium macuxiense]|uniref:Uncharacterized protein n=1 Tax=Bradyrhizobium macuxiense TaxID=1755647 RepID=A0A560LBW7_9BRAD|nr:hypothetical protein FBZ93_111107 [Bradyrhizobium macuxiense]